MSRTSALITLGILIVLVPFSGLPVSFRSFTVFLSGAAVLGIALSLRSREVRNKEAGGE